MTENLIPLGTIATNARVLIRRSSLDPEGSCDIIIYFPRDSERETDPPHGDPNTQTSVLSGDLHAHSPYAGADISLSTPTNFVVKVTVDSKKPGTGGAIFDELVALFK